MNESFDVNRGGAPAAGTAETGGQPGTAPETSGGAEWTAGLSAENLELVGKYGYKNLDDVVGRIRQIESVGGEDALRSVLVPNDEADGDAWNDLYAKLGRPETAEAYGLGAALAGQEMTALDDAFLGNMSAAMHKAGLSTKQAVALTRACNDQFQALIESQNEQYEKSLAEAREMFPPQTIEKAKRAMRAAGLDKEARQDLERALGPKRAIELFSAAAGVLEDSMPADSGGGAFTGSPAAASAKIDHLMSDPHFVKLYMDGNPAAIRQMEELSKKAVNKE